MTGNFKNEGVKVKSFSKNNVSGIIIFENKIQNNSLPKNFCLLIIQR